MKQLGGDERLVEAAARAIYRRRFPHATIDDHFEWYVRGAPDPDSCVHYSNVEFAYIDARAALEAAEQATYQLRDGWKQVPVNITNAMKNAAWVELSFRLVGEPDDRMERAWAAALAVAPIPVPPKE